MEIDGQRLTHDPMIRSSVSQTKLTSLQPVFREGDPSATVTAASSSPVTDGASAVLVMSRAKVPLAIPLDPPPPPTGHRTKLAASESGVLGNQGHFSCTGSVVCPVYGFSFCAATVCDMMKQYNAHTVCARRPEHEASETYLRVTQRTGRHKTIVGELHLKHVNSAALNPRPILLIQSPCPSEQTGCCWVQSIETRFNGPLGAEGICPGRACPRAFLSKQAHALQCQCWCQTGARQDSGDETGPHGPEASRPKRICKAAPVPLRSVKPARSVTSLTVVAGPTQS